MKDNDEFAFPHQDAGYLSDFCHGMTLRDYFAAKVIQSFMQDAIAPSGVTIQEQIDLLSQRAYEVADAMLRAKSSSEKKSC